MIRLFMAGMLCCLASSAFAAEPGARGFYMGVMGGVTEFDDDGLFDGLDFDNEDAGVAAFAGYKILKYLAVEGRVSYLGSYQVSDLFFSDDIELSALSGHVVGIIPFGASGWELFGQLGVGVVNADCDACSGDQTVGSAGVGVRFFPSPNFGISLQTDAYAYEEDDNTFGGSYDVAVIATQLGLQYLF